MTMGNWKNGLAPLNCDEHTLEQLQNNFIFSPSSSVTRIVYILPRTAVPLSRTTG